MDDRKPDENGIKKSPPKAVIIILSVLTACLLAGAGINVRLGSRIAAMLKLDTTTTGMELNASCAAMCCQGRYFIKRGESWRQVVNTIGLSSLRDFEFAEITADISIANASLAGYADEPDIIKVHKLTEISLDDVIYRSIITEYDPEADHGTDPGYRQIFYHDSTEDSSTYCVILPDGYLYKNRVYIGQYKDIRDIETVMGIQH